MASEADSGSSAGNRPIPVGDGKTETSLGQDLTLKVLGAVGTGLGILGFVTFFGGAILWIRANRAHLPANDAVSVIPNSVLVTTGASFLVPAVLLALLAVTLIFLLHLGFDLWRKFHSRRVLSVARELRIEAERQERDAEAKTQLAQAARALATSLSDQAEQAEKGSSVTAEMQARLTADAEAQRQEAEKREARALEATAEAAAMRAEAGNLEAESELVLYRGQFWTELVLGGLLLLLFPPLVNAAITHLEVLEVIALVLVAVVAAATSLVVYATTEKIVWFGVVAFVTVGIYLGFATYFSTVGNPKVEPAAALRSEHPPVIGIFIADTASNLYLGTFPGSGTPSRLLAIPRAQVTDLAIGPLLDRDEARRRAVALALAQCKLTISKPKTETEPASRKPACTTGQEHALTSQLG